MSLPLKGWNSFLDFIGSVVFLHGAVKPELPASEEASRGYEGTLDSLSLAEILPSPSLTVSRLTFLSSISLL